MRLNFFSVLTSAMTVVFTFLIIVKLIKRWRGEAKNWEDRLILYASGAFGAMAFAFTDSFWFNAVEAEVFGLSMLFTSAVIYLALLWEEQSAQASSLVLIILIFYLFGMANGVHLENILAFPFVLMIAFFPREPDGPEAPDPDRRADRGAGVSVFHFLPVQSRNHGL